MKKNILNEEIFRIKNMMKKITNEDFLNDSSKNINFPQSLGGSKDDFDYKRDIRDLTKDWEDFKSERKSNAEDFEKLKKGAKIYGYRSRGQFGDNFGISRMVIAFDKDEAIKMLKRYIVDDKLSNDKDIDSESYGKKRLEMLKNLVIDPSKVEDVTSQKSSDLLKRINQERSVEDDFSDHQHDAYNHRYGKDW